jgi:hypothetical protein
MSDDQDGAKSLEPPRLLGRRRRSPRASQEPSAAPEPSSAPATPSPEPVDAATAAPPSAGGDTRVLPEVAGGFVDAGSDPVPAIDPSPDEPTPAGGASSPRVAPARRRAARPARGPLVVPRYAGAAAAGLVAGIAMLCFVWLAFRGCDALSGTGSCGTGPGMVFLVVVFALTVLVGRALLALLKIPEAGMTAFLAVGVTSLVAVLAPGDLLDSAAILVVLPLLSAGTFAASSWVATLQLDASG